MKEYSNIIAALILGMSLIIVAFIFYESNRYEVKGAYLLDKYRKESYVIRSPTSEERIKGQHRTRYDLRKKNVLFPIVITSSILIIAISTIVILKRKKRKAKISKSSK